MRTNDPGRALIVFLAALIFCFSAEALAARTNLGRVKLVRTEGYFVELTCENGEAHISRKGPGLLHIHIVKGGTFEKWQSFSVVGTGPPETPPDLGETETMVVLDTGELRLEVLKRDGAMRVFGKAGNILFDEPEGGGVVFDGETLGCVKKMPEDEHYYGFGEKTGPLDKRGERMVMWNTNMFYDDRRDPMYQSHPFFMTLRDGRAAGLFFDNTFKTVFDMGNGDPTRYSFTAAGGELDYWIVAGPSPRDVLENYGELTGTMPLPPLWGIGYHQSRWGYRTADMVREVAAGFKRHKIPVGAIYLDIDYMDGYRVFTFDDGRFPDPAGLIAELRRDGIRTVAIVDPGVKIDPEYRVYREGMEKDYFFKDVTGDPFMAHSWPGPVHYPDFYRPEVRDWWAGLHGFYTDLGVAGIWNDMNEPAGWGKRVEIGPFDVPLSRADWSRARHGVPPSYEEHARIHNVYALLEAEATEKGLLKARPGERTFILTRSGFAGIQRHALSWTGDNISSWSSFRAGFPMLLNMGLSGLAFSGADIGGFIGSPSKELMARWMEAGVFYPFCRNHNKSDMPDQEPWSFGSDVTDISRKHIGLRYRLLPYTYTVFEESSRRNWPVMRAMVFEYPEDLVAGTLDEQFMWGEWLLVAPVTENRRREKNVYLPDDLWYDFHTGERVTGSGWKEVGAPIGGLPIFVKGGAIVPMAPEAANSGKRSWSPLVVAIYPGIESSSFTLYEDDGESFDYKRGEYARTRFECVPKKDGVEIGIGEREGSFDPGRQVIELRVFGLAPEMEAEVMGPHGGKAKNPPAIYNPPTGAWLIQLPADGRKKTVRVRLKKEEGLEGP